MHDPSAVLSITNPDLFGTIEAPVRVITEGERIGQTVADSGQNTRPVRICTTVDAPAVSREFVRIVSAADRAREDRLG